jgi:hypothetical protein
MKKRTPFLTAFAVLFTIGAVVAGVAFSRIDRTPEIKTSIAKGKVVASDYGVTDSGIKYFATIQFVNPAGKSFVFKSGKEFDNPVKVGSKIDVVYVSDNPKNAEIAGFVTDIAVPLVQGFGFFALWALYLVLTIVSAVFALSFWFLRWRKKRISRIILKKREEAAKLNRFAVN